MTSWAGAKMPLSNELADAVLEVLAAFRRRLGRARARSGTADARDADAALAPADAADLAGRALPFARRPAPLPLSVRRPQRAHRPRQPARVAAREGRSRTRSASRSTTTASSCCAARPVDPTAARRPEPVRRRRPAARRAREPQLERARAPALPRDRARLRADLHGYPGRRRSTRQLQASSSLFYEVFRKYDAGNMLLGQAESEVLSQELDLGRCARC